MCHFLSQLVRIARSVQSPLGRRWFHWGITVVVVCVIGMLLLPVLRRNPEAVHSYFASAHAWQRPLAIFVATSGLFLILFKLLSPKYAHLRVFLRHPSMWTAWAVAGGILCIADLIFGLGPPGFSAAGWEWGAYCGGAVIAVAGIRWVFNKSESAKLTAASSTELSVDEMIRDWHTLEQWLQSENVATVDLIGNRRIARRLASILVKEHRTVGLDGLPGSGKSTIINWIKLDVEESDQNEPRVLFCGKSCWGFEDSTSAIQQLLSEALEKVGRHADCFSIRSLPETYRKTFSAGGDWIRNLADLVLGTADPMEQFQYVDEILLSINAKLVFIIEDLDRNSSSRFDRQEVLALLQRLRNFDHFSFILAAGRGAAHDIDFAQLCDHIELLREFDADRVASLIGAVRTRCFESFDHMRTVAANDDPWNPAQYTLLTRFDYMPLTTVAARLLRTPRDLKHSLRRTYRAWGVLFGEVDFDHLVNHAYTRPVTRMALRERKWQERSTHLKSFPRILSIFMTH